MKHADSSCTGCGSYRDDCQCLQREEDRQALARLIGQERYSYIARRDYDDAMAHAALRRYGYER